jgi:hypothetical protein
MDKVQAVLVKESWDEGDIKILMSNLNLLPVSAKVKLGLVPTPMPVEAVKEPVIITGEAKVAKMIIAEQSVPPKKRGKKI